MSNDGTTTSLTGTPDSVKKAAHRSFLYLMDEIDNLDEIVWMGDSLAVVLQQQLRCKNMFLDLESCKELVNEFVESRFAAA